MKKNIIFDKNLQLQNGIDVNSINATNIVVETVSQTGDLSIDGNLTISKDLDINGITLYNSSNELNVNTTINTTGNVNIGKYVTSELYNGSSGTFNIQVTTFGTPIYTNGMDGITSANSGLQIGWNNTSFYGETDFLNWAQQGLGGFHFYSISSFFPLKLVAFLSINGSSYIADSLGIKTQTPAYDLDVNGNINFSGNIYQNGKIFTGSNSFTGNVDISGNLTVSGNITATSFNATSDRRIKDNILPIVNETIDLIKPRKYFNKLTNKQEYGFIADELQEVYENIVNGEKDGDILQSVNYIQIIPILVKEMQDLKRGLNALHLDLSMRESKNR